jgi:hypothetical protein
MSSLKSDFHKGGVLTWKYDAFFQAGNGSAVFVMLPIGNRLKIVYTT